MPNSTHLQLPTLFFSINRTNLKSVKWWFRHSLEASLTQTLMSKWQFSASSQMLSESDQQHNAACTLFFLAAPPQRWRNYYRRSGSLVLVGCTSTISLSVSSIPPFTEEWNHLLPTHYSPEEGRTSHKKHPAFPQLRQIKYPAFILFFPAYPREIV